MHVPSDVELVGRLVLALVLGGLIGFERELREHPAGLRTHITVAIGSALFVLVGAYGLEQFVSSRNSTDLTVSPDRVASTVVTGIGFLGGGAILKQGATVKGLTTAGSLWVTSAIGMAVGFGSYVVAVAATILTLVSLVLLRRPERFILRRLAADRETVVLHLEEGADPSSVIAALADLDGVTMRSMTVHDSDQGAIVEATLRGPHRAELLARIAPLASRDDVRSAEVAD